MSRNKIKKKELVRFLFGGGSAVAVDFITYQIFLKMGIEMDYAKGISFLCGSVVGFILNKLWTFECKRFSKGEIVRYALLYSCTAMINSFVNRLVFVLLPIKMAGFLCATGVSTVLNFLGQKYFVFIRKKEPGNMR